MCENTRRLSLSHRRGRTRSPTGTHTVVPMESKSDATDSFGK